MAALEWKYYIVYCCWLAFEFVVLYFTVIETVGKNGPLPLEVTNFLFDGDDKRERLEAHGRDAVGKGPDFDSGETKQEVFEMDNKIDREARPHVTATLA
jgi:hypothetical protein